MSENVNQSPDRPAPGPGDIPGSEPISGLRELLKLGLVTPDAWSPAELNTLLQERLTQPVQFELGALDVSQGQTVRVRAAAHGLLLKNFQDLLKHPNPPLELLAMAKDYFKAHTVRPEPELPAEVARALYYATIAVAWLRHHKRITRLNDSELFGGMEWMEKQAWIIGDLRAFATRAKADFAPP